MKTIFFLRPLVIGILFFAISIYSPAQTKIAIVSLADSTLVNQHVGVTIFGNFTDTLHLDFSAVSYVEQQLHKYLAPYYTVSSVKLPDSATNGKSGLFGNWGINKAIKKWIGDSQNLYDIVIFTYSGGIPTELNMLVPENTSGLYSRGRNEGFYTTIFFKAYRTKNLEEIEYYNYGGKLVSPLEDFRLPDDNRSLTPEMLEMTKTGLAKHLDSKVVRFLTKTYFVDQQKIDNVNSADTHN
jgi:hypothetical protein